MGVKICSWVLEAATGGMTVLKGGRILEVNTCLKREEKYTPVLTLQAVVDFHVQQLVAGVRDGEVIYIYIYGRSSWLMPMGSTRQLCVPCRKASLRGRLEQAQADSNPKS